MSDPVVTLAPATTDPAVAGDVAQMLRNELLAVEPDLPPLRKDRDTTQNLGTILDVSHDTFCHLLATGVAGALGYALQKVWNRYRTRVKVAGRFGELTFEGDAEKFLKDLSTRLGQTSGGQPPSGS
jgi:hypothetical protein